MLQTKSFRTVFQLFQYQSPGNVDRLLATVIKSRRCFCPFLCLHCIHWEYCHQLPAVHSDDVIPITDLPARLDQHSLFSFIISASLSLPLLWHHSIHASFTSSFNSSLYHLLMLFSTLVQPFVWLADLILPSRFMFLFPAGFWMWGGGVATNHLCLPGRFLRVALSVSNTNSASHVQFEAVFFAHQCH